MTKFWLFWLFCGCKRFSPRKQPSEKKLNELSRAEESFEEDSTTFTSILASSSTSEKAKQALWQDIAKKYGIYADLIKTQPGELEWDGEKVVLKYRGPKVEEITENFTIENLGIEMVKVVPGTFLIGSPESEKGRDVYEKQVQMTLTEVYWMGKHEVTQGQWEILMGNNPSSLKSAGHIAPVEMISWEDTQEFIRKLNDQEWAAERLPEGYVYQLPAEVQWEFACRAGSSGAIYWEEDLKILGRFNAPTLDPSAWYGGDTRVSYLGMDDSSDWPEKQCNQPTWPCVRTPKAIS